MFSLQLVQRQGVDNFHGSAMKKKINEKVSETKIRGGSPNIEGSSGLSVVRALPKESAEWVTASTDDMKW